MAKNFEKISDKIRWRFLDLIQNKFKYHLGGTASCIDLMVVLFFGGFVNLSKKNRPIFLLSKGHALGGFYSILIEKKLISKNKLLKLNKEGNIGGQLDIFNFKKFVDTNTGSLGHAIGIGIGHALSNPKRKIWIIIGDAEIDEGSIWEALFFISENRINNLRIIIDRNKISASTNIEKKEIFDSKILEKLYFKLFYVNGHDHKKIFKCFNQTKSIKKSAIIIANTIKGKGFGIAENNINYSHQSLNQKEVLKLKNKYGC